MPYFESFNCLFPRSQRDTSAETYANPSLSLTTSTDTSNVDFYDETNDAPDASQLNRSGNTKNCCLEFSQRLSHVLVSCGIFLSLAGVGLPVGLGILLLGLLIFAISTAAIASKMPPAERPVFIVCGMITLIFVSAFTVTFHCLGVGLGLGLNVT